MGDFALEAVGRVHSTRKAAIDDLWDTETSWIEVFPTLPSTSLDGIEAFSHVEVIYFMHEAKEIEAGARHPRGNPSWPKVGTFAQRAKGRPNRLGATVCRVLRRHRNCLYVEGLDAIDGTPVLDIKPWMREFGPRGEVRQPAWSTELMRHYWSAGDATALPSWRLPRLTTDRLVLRLPEERDVPAQLRYSRENDERLRPFDPPRPEGYFSETYWSSVARRAREEFAAGQALRLLAFKPGCEETLVGRINLTQIFRGPFQAGYLGYSVDGAQEGQGFMTEALSAVIDHAFGPMGLHRLMANHLPENERSAQLLRRLGFAVEGRAKEYLFIDGKWRDHVLTSLINPDATAPGA